MHRKKYHQGAGQTSAWPKRVWINRSQVYRALHCWPIPNRNHRRATRPHQLHHYRQRSQLPPKMNMTDVALRTSSFPRTLHLKHWAAKRSPISKRRPWSKDWQGNDWWQHHWSRDHLSPTNCSSKQKGILHPKTRIFSRFTMDQTAVWVRLPIKSP